MLQDRSTAAEEKKFRKNKRKRLKKIRKRKKGGEGWMRKKKKGKIEKIGDDIEMMTKVKEMG